MTIYDFNFEDLWSGDLNFYFEPEQEQEESSVVTIPLNIGTNVLDLWYSGCYIIVCTNSGVECLNSRSFESVWYFDSDIVKVVCCNEYKICFGTISSGIYYSNFPEDIGYLGCNFLSGCSNIEDLASNSISDICSVVATTYSGFFSSDDCGVSVLVDAESGGLDVGCSLEYNGIISVAYSEVTETYYWSTASEVYCATICGDSYEVVSAASAIANVIAETPVSEINTISLPALPSFNTSASVIAETPVSGTNTISLPAAPSPNVIASVA